MSAYLSWKVFCFVFSFGFWLNGSKYHQITWIKNKILSYFLKRASVYKKGEQTYLKITKPANPVRMISFEWSVISKPAAIHT